MQHFAILVNAEQIVPTHQDKFFVAELHVINTKRTVYECFTCSLVINKI